MKVKNVSPLDGFFVNQQKPFIRYAFNSIEKKNATLFLIFGSSKRNQTTNDSIKIIFFLFISDRNIFHYSVSLVFFAYFFDLFRYFILCAFLRNFFDVIRTLFKI